MKRLAIKANPTKGKEIISFPCPYIASRHNEPIKTTLHSNLCLNDAYDILLNMFNQQFDTCFNNWGLAVISTNHRHDSACKTSSDKTRRYDYDSRIYQIEVEEL